METAIPSFNHPPLHEYGECYSGGVDGWWSPHGWAVSDLYPRLAPSPSASVAAEVQSGGII